MVISENAPKKAREYLDKGYNCAEATFLALVENNAPEELLRVVTPFGGGIGASRDVCGIITGGAMAIGFYYGRTNPNDLETKKKNYRLTRDFLNWISSNYAKKCEDIVVTDNFKGHTEVCLDMIENSVDFLRNLILNSQ